MLDSAIVKHAAWAAAMSCSGLVSGLSPSPKRELAEYRPWKTPSPTLTVPDPVCRSPRHSALPFRLAMVSLLGSFLPRRLSHPPRRGRSLEAHRLLGWLAELGSYDLTAPDRGPDHRLSLGHPRERKIDSRPWDGLPSQPVLHAPA